MQWPSIPGSDFRGEFERLWKIYDLNDDGTIAGMELSLFLDALTNLLKRYYGAWKPWQEIRQGLQYDLDKNFDGQITRAEANAFLEKRQASGAAPSYDSPDFVQQYKPPVKRYGKTTTWHSTWSTSGSTGGIGWPKIDNPEFEFEFERLWSYYDRDKSNSMNGPEVPLFLDAITTLLQHYYVSWKSWEDLREAVQWDLDRNCDGVITRKEAHDFVQRRRKGESL
jgi:Ca2+-binding EF-hand superfamily protein